MEAHHEYRVNAFGAGGRNGVVHAEGVLSCISFSAPPEFLGEPGRWTPEHFLVAAVASCFVSTFSGISEKSRFEFVSFQLEAEGALGNEDSAVNESFSELEGSAAPKGAQHPFAKGARGKAAPLPTAAEHARRGILDYPHYTRPPEFEGMRVPDVLLTGHHAEIERWRREAAEEKTKRNRPDLLK